MALNQFLKAKSGDWGNPVTLKLEPEIRHALSYVVGDIKQGKSVWPSKDKWFKAFQVCPYPPKTVILGQDS